MVLFGNITSYDSVKGVGVISPEKGGEDLAFKKGDLQQQARDPELEQRYRYETVHLDVGRMRAVNLRQVYQGQVSQGPATAGSHENLVRDQARQQKG